MYWTGYKLHLDTIDGGIPVSALVTSASLNDSQAAIPLATITGERIINCYDLMDAILSISLDRKVSCQLLRHPCLICMHNRITGHHISWPVFQKIDT